MRLLMMVILTQLGSEVHYPQACLVDDSQLLDLEEQSPDFVGVGLILTYCECHRSNRSFSFDLTIKLSSAFDFKRKRCSS